jgi:PAS domain S-box-containing protein
MIEKSLANKASRKTKAELAAENLALQARLEVLQNAAATRAQPAADHDVSLATLREAVEGIQDGFALYDAEDRFVFCNEAYRAGDRAGLINLLKPGVTFEEILRARIAEGLILGARERPEEWILERLEQHRRGGVQMARQRDSDEARRTILLNEYKTRGGSTVIMRTDISDRVRAEEALRESEERFRTAFDNSIVGIAIIGKNNDIRLVNPALARMLGYPTKELQTLRLSNLRIRGPEDAARADQMREDLEVGKTERSIEEEQFRRKDGSSVWCETSRAPIFDAEGNLTYRLTIRQDITARKRAVEALRESERIFRSIFENTDVGMTVVSLDRKMRLFNPALFRIFGYTPEEFESIKLRDLEHPDDADTSIRRMVADGVLSQEHDKRFLHKDGHYITCRVSCSLVIDDDDNIQYGVNLFRDITESRQIEQQLRQSQKMEAIGQLTGGLTHDFNNLLSVVLINLQLAEVRLTGDPDTRKHIEAASKATLRGADLTKRLLSFSRQQILQPEAVNVDAVVEEMSDLLRRTIGESIDISLHPTDDLWATNVDPAQLETAILNLVLNARDAMPDGGLLSIESSNVKLNGGGSARPADVTPGRYVVLAMTDTGIGMSRQAIDNAFEPFFSTKEVGKGTGLGLSMVYGFVKQSNGHVRWSHFVGQSGSQVKVYSAH